MKTWSTRRMSAASGAASGCSIGEKVYSSSMW
jgi:hypothetical protein